MKDGKFNLGKPKSENPISERFKIRLTPQEKTHYIRKISFEVEVNS
jgi:hypothetical protein